MKKSMLKVIAVIAGLVGLTAFHKVISAEELLKTKAQVKAKSFSEFTPSTQDV